MLKYPQNCEISAELSPALRKSIPCCDNNYPKFVNTAVTLEELPHDFVILHNIHYAQEE